MILWLYKQDWKITHSICKAILEIISTKKTPNPKPVSLSKQTSWFSELITCPWKSTANCSWLPGAKEQPHVRTAGVCAPGSRDPHTAGRPLPAVHSRTRSLPVYFRFSNLPVTSAHPRRTARRLPRCTCTGHSANLWNLWMMLYKTCKYGFVMRNLGKMIRLKSLNLQEQKCGARRSSSSDGSGQPVAAVPFFFPS